MDGRLRVKVVLLGDPGVSKTNLLREFRNVGINNEAFRIVHFQACELEILLTRSGVTGGDDERSVVISVWDTCGQEKYRSLTASYYRGAHGCLVLYDVTKESSFENLSHWLHDLKEYTSQPEISTIIVGTKCHVDEDKREVTYERAQKYAESLNLPYMEVSAEEGINITEVFEKLADLIIESLNKDTVLSPIQPDTRGVTLISDTTKRKKQWCSC